MCTGSRHSACSTNDGGCNGKRTTNIPWYSVGVTQPPTRMRSQCDLVPARPTGHCQLHQRSLRVSTWPRFAAQARTAASVLNSQCSVPQISAVTADEATCQVTEENYVITTAMTGNSPLSVDVLMRHCVDAVRYMEPVLGRVRMLFPHVCVGLVLDDDFRFLSSPMPAAE